MLRSQEKGAEDKQNIYFDSSDQRETKEETRWIESAVVIQPFFYQPITEQNLSIIFDFGGLSCLSLKYDGSGLFISLSLLFLELANGVFLRALSCLTDLNFGNIVIIL